MISIDQMKHDLHMLDHDCSAGPDDGCNWCYLVFFQMTDEEVKKNWEEHVQKKNSA